MAYCSTISGFRYVKDYAAAEDVFNTLKSISYGSKSASKVSVTLASYNALLLVYAVSKLPITHANVQSLLADMAASHLTYDVHTYTALAMLQSHWQPRGVCP